MRIVALLILMSVLGLASAVLAEAPPLEALQQDNALLQAELRLAKSGSTYLLIDLQERRLQLKTSGLVLQSWGIDRYRRWGQPSALPVSIMESKSSFDEPEREVQVVNATEPSEDNVRKPFRALELTDMPTAYRMRLVNGTEITVRPTPVGRLGRIYDVFAVPTWYLSRPLISSWSFLRSSPYNELALSMSDQDARKLYWAFSEGTPCLIRLPAAAVAIVPLTDGTKQ